jgi:hypothetical protein
LPRCSRELSIQSLAVAQAVICGLDSGISVRSRSWSWNCGYS